MKKGLQLKEALFWVILAGVAAHATLWLVAEASNTFYDSSIYKLTGTLPTSEKK